MKKIASVTSVKGRITVQGVRTVFEADGVTVKDQKAMLKVHKGLFSKRFLVPLGLFSLDQLTQAMEKNEDFFPIDSQLHLENVTKVEGMYRTYEANLTSMFRPVSPKALVDLVNSKTISKKP